MEYAGRGGPARHGGDAGRDRRRGHLPALAAGSAVPALRHRDGGARESVPRPLVAGPATPLVPRMRLGWCGAPGAPRAHAEADPSIGAASDSLLINPAS